MPQLATPIPHAIDLFQQPLDSLREMSKKAERRKQRKYQQLIQHQTPLQKQFSEGISEKDDESVQSEVQSKDTSTERLGCRAQSIRPDGVSNSQQDHIVVDLSSNQKEERESKSSVNDRIESFRNLESQRLGENKESVNERISESDKESIVGEVSQEQIINIETQIQENKQPNIDPVIKNIFIEAQREVTPGQEVRSPLGPEKVLISESMIYTVKKPVFSNLKFKENLKISKDPYLKIKNLLIDQYNDKPQPVKVTLLINHQFDLILQESSKNFVLRQWSVQKDMSLDNGSSNPQQIARKLLESRDKITLNPEALIKVLKSNDLAKQLIMALMDDEGVAAKIKFRRKVNGGAVLDFEQSIEFQQQQLFEASKLPGGKFEVKQRDRPAKLEDQEDFKSDDNDKFDQVFMDQEQVSFPDPHFQIFNTSLPIPDAPSLRKKQIFTPQSISKKTIICQSFKNQQLSLKGISYSFNFAQQSSGITTKIIYQRIMKNLEFANPDNLNSIFLKFAMVSIREETSRSGKVCQYYLQIQDRLKLSNDFRMLLPVSQIDHSDLQAIEANIVRFVNNQIVLSDIPSGQILQLNRPPNYFKKIKICKVVKRIQLETIQSDTEPLNLFCVLEVNFLGEPFNKWQITIHANKYCQKLVFSIDLEELLEINEKQKNLYEVLSFIQQKALAVQIQANKDKSIIAGSVCSNEVNESKFTKASNISKITPSKNARKPPKAGQKPLALEKRTSSAHSVSKSQSKLNGTNSNDLLSVGASASPSKSPMKKKMKVKKRVRRTRFITELNEESFQNTSTQVIPLNLKNLRRFDRQTGGFQDKDFNEEFSKSKVEVFVQKQLQSQKAKKETASFFPWQTKNAALLQLGLQNLDRISEEKESRQSTSMIGQNSKVPKANSPEMNFIDIDKFEQDLQYLQNAFNYHSNRLSFWQHCILDKIKLVQKLKAPKPDLHLSSKVFVEIQVPNQTLDQYQNSQPNQNEQSANDKDQQSLQIGQYQKVYYKIEQIVVDWTQFSRGDDHDLYVGRAYFSDSFQDDTPIGQKAPVVIEVLPLIEKNPGAEIPSLEMELENAILEEILLDKTSLREVVMHHLFSKYELFNKDFVYRRKFDHKNFDTLMSRMRIANELTFSQVGALNAKRERTKFFPKLRTKSKNEVADAKKLVFMGKYRLLSKVFVQNLKVILQIQDYMRPDKSIELQINPYYNKIHEDIKFWQADDFEGIKMFRKSPIDNDISSGYPHFINALLKQKRDSQNHTKSLMPVYLRLLEIYEHELTMKWVLKYGESKLRMEAKMHARARENKLFEEARQRLKTQEESKLMKAARLGEIADDKVQKELEVWTQPQIPPLKLSLIKKKRNNSSKPVKPDQQSKDSQELLRAKIIQNEPVQFNKFQDVSPEKPVQEEESKQIQEQKSVNNTRVTIKRIVVKKKKKKKKKKKHQMVDELNEFNDIKDAEEANQTQQQE